jgi:neutral ceramidase
LKKILRWFLGTTAVLFVIAIALIGPVDNSPLASKEFYKTTMHRLDTFSPTIHPPKTKLRASWAKVNITPAYFMPMAGYAPRNHFDSVHDSVYVRILVIDNGGIQCSIISADLLIFPPALKNKILQQKNKNQFFYFTATHAHSSLGAWDNSVIGNLILGSYNEPWLDSLANKIHLAIDSAATHLQPSSINYFEVNANEYIENRLDPEHGQVDGMIRGLKITREDGTKGLMVSYSAHPTNISHLSLALSGDYPSSLVRQAERYDFDFAMFASGTIGSHRVKGISESEFILCDTLANRLYKKVSAARITPIKDSTIATSILPINYGPSQLHILQKYKVRDWVFQLLFRKLNGDIRYLKIGNIILLGTPCDFSGEILVRNGLDKIAESQGQKLFITSFNGDYVGYITYDDYYGRSEQEEVMAMNWVGPHFGSYYSQIIKKIIKRSK